MARSSEDDEDNASSEVGCCTKYTMFIVNVIFFLMGFLMVALGTYCQIDNGGMLKKMQNSGQFAMVDPTILLIFIGFFIFIIGFCGCLGSLRENTILLTIYAWALIIILVLQLLIGIGLYFYKDRAIKHIEEMLGDTIPAYSSNDDLQEMIDTIQISMKCCGIKSPNDWDANPYFMKAADGAPATPDSDGVPYSCCADPYKTVESEKGEPPTTEIDTTCGRQKRKTGLDNNIFGVGCVQAIDEWTKTNGLTFTIALGGVLLVQGIAIIMAQNLKADVKAQRAKWME